MDENHSGTNLQKQSGVTGEGAEMLDSHFPSYDVVWASDRYRVDAVNKLIQLVNEKMKQGYIPIGGFFIETSEMPNRHTAYQAMMLPK